MDVATVLLGFFLGFVGYFISVIIGLFGLGNCFFGVCLSVGVCFSSILPCFCLGRSIGGVIVVVKLGFEYRQYIVDCFFFKVGFVDEYLTGCVEYAFSCDTADVFERVDISRFYFVLNVVMIYVFLVCLLGVAIYIYHISGEH